jgi:VanZ family protein
MIVKSGQVEAGKMSGDWRRRMWRYAPLILWMAFITFASTGEFSASNTSRILRPFLLWLFPHITAAKIDRIHFLIRKAAHFTEYAVFALLAARALATSSRRFLHQNWFVLSLLLVAAYALLDEYHQSFVATRTASVYDSLIDTAGGLFALLLYALWRGRKSKGGSSRSQVKTPA